MDQRSGFHFGSVQGDGTSFDKDGFFRFEVNLRTGVTGLDQGITHNLDVVGTDSDTVPGIDQRTNIYGSRRRGKVYRRDIHCRCRWGAEFIDLAQHAVDQDILLGGKAYRTVNPCNDGATAQADWFSPIDRIAGRSTRLIHPVAIDIDQVAVPVDGVTRLVELVVELIRFHHELGQDDTDARRVGSARQVYGLVRIDQTIHEEEATGGNVYRGVVVEGFDEPVDLDPLGRADIDMAGTGDRQGASTRCIRPQEALRTQE